MLDAKHSICRLFALDGASAEHVGAVIHGGGCNIGGFSGAALRPGDWSKQLVATLSTTGSDRPGVCAGCSSPASAADFNNRYFWASAELFYCSACWDQWLKTPRNINLSISGADCAQVLLVAVGDNLASLNEMNLRTAIHRLGKIAGRGGSPKIIIADRRFEGLLNCICETQLGGRSVSNIAYGLAKMKQRKLLGAGSIALSAVL